MFARNLMIWLHDRLADRGTFDHTIKRFESLRGHGLLPRGREGASLRLTNEQIANAVLGFAHPLPGYAGHASLILGDLRPVGGSEASFRNVESFQGVIASLIELGDPMEELLRVSASVEQDFNGEDYAATLYFKGSSDSQVSSYVSKYSTRLHAAGAEEFYEAEKLSKITSVQRSFNSVFFRNLSREVSISRELNLPLKTDWREYESEEEKAEFNRKLGARRSSRFMNLRVDSHVTWPREPTRVKFGDHYFVLFPKTKEYSCSISIDLTNEKISATEARSLINRMLSVMSWCEDQPSSLHEGWSGNPVPVPVGRSELAFTTTHNWYFNRLAPVDEKLRKCLAFYRDGLNAYSVGLASHAVLSFYRVFEIKYSNRKEVIHWVNSLFAGSNIKFSDSGFDDFEEDRRLTGNDPGTYVYVNCRVATAHAARDAPSDPDGASETRRLLNASQVIKHLARYFIKQEFKYSDSYLSDTFHSDDDPPT